MARAVFGGTFDPVHLGHKAMVESALSQFDLSEILIVPNGNPPHKSHCGITDFSHRYKMLEIAFQNNSKVGISDYEANEDKPSYSVYTMRYFRETLGEDTYFILGADSLLTIHRWYDFKSLLKENKFIVFKRDGDEALNKAISTYRNEGVEILTSQMPKIDISSTDIRNSFKEGVLWEDALDPDVVKYIISNNLYGGSK